MIGKEQLIDKLVGVNASRQNYYTQLKKSISELEKKNTQLEIINEVMKSFNVEMSMDDMLCNILHKLKMIYPFSRLSLSYYDRDIEKLYVTNVYPSTATYEFIGTNIPIERSIYWKVIEENHHYNHIVSSSDYVEDHSFKALSLQQVLIFPLRSKGNIVGTFSLGTEITTVFEASEINFLQQLSDQLAVSIENVYLYQRVLQGKEEWEHTFSAVVDIILLVDVNGKILRENEAGRRLLHQYDKAGHALRNIHTLLYDTMLPKESMIHRCVETKQAVYEEVKLQNDSYYEVYAYPVFNERNELYHIITYMKDVTNKRYYEMQLLQSSKLAAIGEMAAGVAHELNNPLTAILGNTQLLLRKSDEKQSSHELLKDVLDAGKRCQNIVQNLLTFSRQEAYLFESCSLNEAIGNVLGLIGYQITQQNIQIIPKLASDLSEAEASMQQIEQIIINLVLNAKDALEEKTGHDKVIRIKTYEDEAFVYLVVSDNGMGMDETALQNVFDPFFTTKEAKKGTGLGLSVSLGIAVAHEGDISVVSNAGQGSAFTLKIPKIRVIT